MSDAARRDSALPPLRLHHFFVWTAVSAVLLGISSSTQSSIPQLARWWMLVELPDVLAAALALSCLAFGVFWRRLGLPFPSQPGHGLVIWHGVSFAASLVHGVLWLAIFQPMEPGNQWNTSPPAISFLEWGQHLIAILSIALLIWLAWWARPARRWQAVFLLNALFAGRYLIAGLAFWFSWDVVENLQVFGPTLATIFKFVLGTLPQLIPGIALAVAVRRDRRAGIRRHWSHWAGVAVWCAGFLSAIAFQLIASGWLPEPFTLDVIEPEGVE